MISGGRGPYGPQPVRRSWRRPIFALFALAFVTLLIVDKVNPSPPGSLASDLVQIVPFVLVGLIVHVLVRRATGCRRS